MAEEVSRSESLAEVMRTPQVGDVIAEKYRIDGLLGDGGMGVVAKATHLHLKKPVAIKLLRPEIALRKDAVARFLREAQAASSLQSEHVIRVHDVSSEHEVRPYIVMEYLSGVDLGTWAEQHAPMPVDQTVAFVLQACEGLAEAHARGIVHRDLKPSNLHVSHRADGSPFIKILDFGISKVKDDTRGPEANNLTASRELLGSPLYMSPEQVRGASGVDARSDIWSLGVILYELLTGQPPFDAPTLADLMARILFEPPRPPSELRQELAGPLDALILRCLSKEADARPQSVAELAETLVPWADAETRVYVDRVMRIAGRSAMAPGSRLPERTPAPEQNATAALRLASDPSAATIRAAMGPVPAVTAETRPGTVEGAGEGQPRRTGGAVWIAAIAAVAVVGLSVGGLVVMRGGAGSAREAVSAEATSATAPVPTQPVTASASASGPPAEAATVVVKLRIDPADAVVELDGERVSGSSVVLPRSSSSRKVVVAARGFATTTQSFVPDRDTALEITLERIRPARTKGGSPPAGKSKIEIKGPRETTL